MTSQENIDEKAQKLVIKYKCKVGSIVVMFESVAQKSKKKKQKKHQTTSVTS